MEKITNFKHVYAKAKRFRFPLFLCYSLLETSLEIKYTPLRFAVVASKKGVHKRAVVRNRARRRVRAALRSVLQEQATCLPLAPNMVQLLFLANYAATRCPWLELVCQVRQAVLTVAG